VGSTCPLFWLDELLPWEEAPLVFTFTSVKFYAPIFPFSGFLFFFWIAPILNLARFGSSLLLVRLLDGSTAPLTPLMTWRTPAFLELIVLVRPFFPVCLFPSWDLPRTPLPIRPRVTKQVLTQIFMSPRTLSCQFRSFHL